MDTMDHSGVQQEKELSQFVCFKLAKEEYAIDINLIAEVIKILPVTSVPQVPAYCLGLINCRGTIIPLFDLRKKVLLPEKDLDEKSRILIASIGQDLIGLIIDEILDNIRMDSSQVDLTSTLAMKVGRDYIRGVAKIEERMIAVLDLEKMHSTIKDEMMHLGLEYVHKPESAEGEGRG